MHVTAEIEQCVQDCLDCYRVCLETAAHAAARTGQADAQEALVLLLDCAELCQAAAASMLRNSPAHTVVCGACAEVCEQCAEACDRLAAGNGDLRACAEACRRCAASCRDMAGVAA